VTVSSVGEEDCLIPSWGKVWQGEWGMNPRGPPTKEVSLRSSPKGKTPLTGRKHSSESHSRKSTSKEKIPADEGGVHLPYREGPRKRTITFKGKGHSGGYQLWASNNGPLNFPLSLAEIAVFFPIRGGGGWSGKDFRPQGNRGGTPVICGGSTGGNRQLHESGLQKTKPRMCRPRAQPDIIFPKKGAEEGEAVYEPDAGRGD